MRCGHQCIGDTHGEPKTRDSIHRSRHGVRRNNDLRGCFRDNHRERSIHLLVEHRVHIGKYHGKPKFQYNLFGDRDNERMRGNSQFPGEGECLPQCERHRIAFLNLSRRIFDIDSQWGLNLFMEYRSGDGFHNRQPFSNNHVFRYGNRRQRLCSRQDSYGHREESSDGHRHRIPFFDMRRRIVDAFSKRSDTIHVEHRRVR